MELYLKIAGILLIILALAHVSFPKYFDWKGELGSLSIINRQMMYFHMFFIALGVLLMGILCLTSSRELLTSALGKRISLGLGIFWIVRLLVQFVGYSSKTWKGKSFETSMHILFSALWVFISGVFILTYIN